MREVLGTLLVLVHSSAGTGPGLAVPGAAAPCGASQSALKLTFALDPEYDADAIVQMFRNDDPAGLEMRARSMAIDPGVAKKIGDASTATARTMAASIVQDRFERHARASTIT